MLANDHVIEQSLDLLLHICILEIHPSIISKYKY